MKTTEQTQINSEKNDVHISQQDNKKKSIADKRAELRGLSKGISLLVKEGKYDTVNEGLIEFYESEGHKDLKSFKQWKKDGFLIRKGEHALLLWGKPHKISRKNDINKDEEPEEQAEFFPICFVFSSNQVEKRGGKND